MKKPFFGIIVVIFMVLITINVRAEIDCSHNYCNFKYSYYNDTNHAVNYVCAYCGNIGDLWGYEEHDFWSYNDKYKDFNDKYHSIIQVCYNCGYERVKEREKHDWNDRCIKKATPTTNGLIEYTCRECRKKIVKSHAWDNCDDECVNYSFDFSRVFRNSKYITFKFSKVLNNATIKVKIGKKKYSKKTNKSKKIKIKINNPKYGQRILVSIMYKGEVVYDNVDRVYYGKNIKKGMTKNQVKNLLNWGSCSSSASYSGGWTFWYYDDGSYVGFKNGRVKSWKYVH